MNSFIAVTILIAHSLFVNKQPMQSSLEKRAVADTQRTLASELDDKLPRLPFTEWFGKVVGPGAGVIWQLSECGELVEASSNATVDARACVEVNTIISDGRKVIVMIAVGTFKKGVTGAPAFHFGVIEQKGELLPIRRLRDLQQLLSASGELAKNLTVNLPEVNMPNVRLTANKAYEASGPLEEPPHAEPPLQADLAPSTSTASEESATSAAVKPLGSVSWGGAITRVQPKYPAKAKRVNASGQVDVQVTISAEGRVTQAKATNGHPLLREAAEEAARQWVFKPATLNGAPVETQIVLTFAFKAP